MKSTSLKCTTCGGDIQLQSRFHKTVVCRYCNTVYSLANDAITTLGISQTFEPLSIFKIGTQGTLNGKSFSILGRLRLQDDEDIWDEWFITLDDKPAWIEESSDSIHLLTQMDLTQPVAPYSDISVGTITQMQGADIFIVEKGQAQAIGVEGQFIGKVKPQESFSYIQGFSDDDLYVVEYYDEGIKFFKGQTITPEQVSILK